MSVTAIQSEASRGQAAPELPHNIDAEQTLLGALLVNNDVFDRIEGVVSDEHFFDPVHARIFELIATMIKKNSLASPTILKPYVENDPGLKELGGPAYLARLAGSAVVHIRRPRICPDDLRSRDPAQPDHPSARAFRSRRGQVNAGKSEPNEQIVEAEQQLYSLGEQGPGRTGIPDAFAGRSPTRSKWRTRPTSAEAASRAFRPALVDLDRRLGGLHRSDLIILAGPAVNGEDLARNQHRVPRRIAVQAGIGAVRRGRNGRRGCRRILLAGDVGRTARHARALGDDPRPLGPDPARQPVGARVPPRRRGELGTRTRTALHRRHRRIADQPSVHAREAPENARSGSTCSWSTTSSWCGRRTTGTAVSRKCRRSPRG